MAAQYRKKPIVAVQYLPENWTEVQTFMAVTHQPQPPMHLGIKTLEGVMEVREGDWIIRGVQGEFCPCKPDIFDATYEKVGE